MTGATALPSAAEVDPRAVLIVDDHSTVAMALSMAIGREQNLTVAGAVGTLEEALEVLAVEHVDVVVMDVHLARGAATGIEATSVITTRHPRVRVVMLTAAADFALLAAAAAAGATGYVLKEQNLSDVLRSLRSTHQGGMLVASESLARMQVAADRSPGSDAPEPLPAGRVGYLSGRELEILLLLRAGHDPRSIGRELGMSLNTCRGHLKNLFVKLDAHSQLEAVAIATRAGLIPPLGKDPVSHDLQVR